MKLEIRNSCSDFNSYRAQRVKSLFNCESGANFSLDADIPNDSDWKIGVVVGPSGTGKTSIGKEVWKDVGIYNGDDGWAFDKPIIDCILPNGKFDDVTSAFSAVGLGSVPTWLRPYHALSNGEKFRAGLARVIAEKPNKVIIDEFTSVVDRQIAMIGAGAFSKAFKRGGGQAILLSCHYDILDYIEPDWVFDTRTAMLSRGSLWQRPKIELEIFKTNSSYWGMFEPHHYLKLPKMVAATYYVGFVNGEAVSHIAVSPRLEHNGMRVARFVVMPEWQGCGIGLRFLNEVCKIQFTDINRYYKRVNCVYINTSHPGLCSLLRRDKNWIQISQMQGGSHKGKSINSVLASKNSKKTIAGYGGHLRSVQGFKYINKGVNYG